MEIKTITISELPDFVKSTLYKNSKNCPITIHRAISQSKNPRASKDDPALIIAIDKENIVGYIGFLPDTINDSKVFWNSCWWVDDEYKKIAIPLLLKFIKEGEEKIILTDFTPHTKQIIEKLNFFTVVKLKEGFRGYLKFNLGEILPQRNKKLKPFTPLLKVFDFIANAILPPRAKSTPFKTKTITNFTEGDSQFMTSHSQEELIKRNTPELEWIANNPWVKDTTEGYTNYHFTASVKDFDTKILRLSDKGNVVAIVYLRQLNHQLTIPYIYYKKQYLDQIAQFIYNEAVDNKCINLTTFNANLVMALKKDFNFIIKRELTRDFAYHKSLQHLFKNPVTLQDGDADVAFC